MIIPAIISNEYFETFPLIIFYDSPFLVFLPHLLLLRDAGERLLLPDQGLRQLRHVLTIALAPPITQETFQTLIRLLKGCAFCPSPSWTDRWEGVQIFRFQLLPRVEQGVQEDVAVLKIQGHPELLPLASKYSGILSFTPTLLDLRSLIVELLIHVCFNICVDCFSSVDL